MYVLVLPFVFVVAFVIVLVIAFAFVFYICVCICICIRIYTCIYICNCACNCDWVCICVCACSIIALVGVLIENIYFGVCFTVDCLWNEWNNVVCGPDGWKAVCGPHGLRTWGDAVCGSLMSGGRLEIHNCVLPVIGGELIVEACLHWAFTFL